MARTPATITQADIARAIRAAKQTGASAVEVRLAGKHVIIIHLTPSTGVEIPTLEKSGEIIL